MTHIVSSIPGRIRIRAPGLRNPGCLARLEQTLATVEGVLTVEGNPAAASLVVHFDAATLVTEEVEALVEQCVDDELSQPRSKYRPSTRVRINRAAKYGMLGSLAASLAFAAAGNKRWHAATGVVFIACLGIHLGVHRRHLLR